MKKPIRWEDNRKYNIFDIPWQKSMPFAVLEEQGAPRMFRLNRNRDNEIQMSNEKPEGLIFQRIGNQVQTFNWVGVMSIAEDGKSPVRLEIRSRFDTSGKQYFLLYLLSTVYGFDLYKCSLGSISETDFDAVLVILFGEKLQEAYGEGLFKTYQTVQYNDFAFRGAFDVTRHIRLNTPFIGKTAYRAREHSYDNDLLCMVRQTVEYIKNKFPALWERYCADNTGLYEIENVLQEATPSFQPGVLYQNRPICSHVISNPLYQAYEEVRRLCRRLLAEEGDDLYAEDEEETHGLLIDMSWLWEEFVAVKLMDGLGYRHLHAKEPQYGYISYRKDYRELDEREKNYRKDRWYPDFIEAKAETARRNIFDAKYKFWNYESDDMHQLLSYLFITGGTLCGAIYPSNEPKEFDHIELNAYAPRGTNKKPTYRCYQMPFAVPKITEDQDYDAYCEAMERSILDWKNAFRACVSPS